VGEGLDSESKDRIYDELEGAALQDHRCIERVISNDIAGFCAELIEGGIEGVCSCTYELGWRSPDLLKEKTSDCFRGTFDLLNELKETTEIARVHP
jgi:hypothetical protein